MMMNEGNLMTDLESEIRVMMTPKEEVLLLRVLAKFGAYREGAIVSLICGRLRDMEASGLMDCLYPEIKAPAADPEVF
jgi:hypothetical protein